MGWTYDPTNLGTADAAQRLNSVRLLVGDTDTADQQLQDEEVNMTYNPDENLLYFERYLKVQKRIFDTVA